MINEDNISTVQQAKEDKHDLEAYVIKLIADFQHKHPGLMVESINIITTKVNGYPPVQTVESTIKLV